MYNTAKVYQLHNLLFVAFIGILKICVQNLRIFLPVALIFFNSSKNNKPSVLKFLTINKYLYTQK